jgi:hypothetical protein
MFVVVRTQVRHKRLAQVQDGTTSAASTGHLDMRSRTLYMCVLCSQGEHIDNILAHVQDITMSAAASTRLVRLDMRCRTLIP